MADHGIPRIRIVSATRTCLAAPSSWECRTEDGRYVFLRYRHGRGRVEVDPIPTEYEEPYGWPSESGDHTRLSFNSEPGMTDGYITLADFCRLADIDLSPDLEEAKPYVG